MTIVLSDLQRAVLEHKVLNPEEWVANAIAGLGEEAALVALENKVARWLPEFEATAAQADYNNRVERDAAEEAALKARVAAKRALLEARPEDPDRVRLP